MKYQSNIYTGPRHAFYSSSSVESEKTLYKNDKNDKKHKSTNFYKKNDTNEIVEITAVFSTEKFPDPDDCPYYFDDKVYLGVVDKWVKNKRI